uniref:Uncharacterized protein n=1 Tax=Solanum tuberosum TaxID=4113 RepID=M1D5W1_SOLTU
MNSLRVESNGLPSPAFSSSSSRPLRSREREAKINGLKPNPVAAAQKPAATVAQKS